MTRRFWPVLGLSVAVLLGGCGGDDADPATSGAGRPAEPSAAPDETRAVVRSVTAFNAAVEAMQAGAPVDPAKLRTVATSSLAEQLGESVRQAERSGVSLRQPPGGVKHTRKSLTVKGSTATVVECVDRRGTVLVQDGQAMPTDDALYPPTLFTVTARKADGRWKVSALDEGERC